MKKKYLLILSLVLLVVFPLKIVKATGSNNPLLDWFYSVFGDITIAKALLTLLIIGLFGLIAVIFRKNAIALILGLLALFYCTAMGYCDIWVAVVLCLLTSFFLAKAFKDLADK